MVNPVDKKLTRITPILDGVLYNLYSNGLSVREIVEQMAQSGHTFSATQIYKHSERHGWKEREKAIQEACNKEIIDMQKVSKMKKLTAFQLATSALSEQIVKDYIDFKTDPVFFETQVKNKERRKPIWWTYSVMDAAKLLEIEQFIINDGVKKIEANVNNTVTTVLSPEEEEYYSRVLEAMAQSKVEIAKSKTIDGEVVLLPEKTEEKK